VKRIFISDCEGPISKNDNALEVTTHFVPRGNRIFTLISRYDDALAELARRPAYKAGDTLKLILPFLKAYGVTDQLMEKFSARKLILMPFTKVALKHVKKLAPTYFISTSYEHYVRVLCRSIGFPFNHTFCTKVHLDRYRLDSEERNQLMRIAEKIATMKVFEIPNHATNLKELGSEAQETIRRLDEIFWCRINKMQIGRIYSEINPVGGIEKAKAVRETTNRLSASLCGVMYVGDSITDEDAFKLVKAYDGLAVSFNGNRHAVENADIALMSKDTLITAIIGETFLRFGKEEALGLVANWNRQTLEDSQVNDSLLRLFLKLHPRELPKAKIVTTESMAELSAESSEFRKKVRGEDVGGLG
jgi:energy-converting hydrogenase A subunit R